MDTDKPIWALDTSGVWHLYVEGTRASCGYKTDGGMVDGPRLKMPVDEECCSACRCQISQPTECRPVYREDQMDSLSSQDLNLIAALLSLAGDRFSNDTCTEFDLSKAGVHSRLARLALLTALDQTLMCPEDAAERVKMHGTNDCYWADNWALMYYYAHRLRRIAEGVSTNEQTIDE